MRKSLTVWVIALILAISMTSCSLLDINDRYVGGELLDDEMMSEIMDEIFSDKSDIGEDENFSETEGADNNESVDNADGEEIVYWVENGEVWHTHKDCVSIKDSTPILSGSVDKALEEGKTRLCTRCENKDEE